MLYEVITDFRVGVANGTDNFQTLLTKVDSFGQVAQLKMGDCQIEDMCALRGKVV